MTTKIDSRQWIQRSTLERITNATDSEGDNILAAIDSEITPLLEMRASEPIDLTVNIGNIELQNSESGLKRVLAPISDSIPSFSSGTVTFPSASGSSTTVSAGTDITITISNDSFLKVGIHVDSNGDISLNTGTEGASESAATLPPALAGTKMIGYVTLETVGSTIQNIENSRIYQFVGPGLQTLIQDAAPELGGDLTIGDNVLIHNSDGIKKGASATDFYEEEYVHSITLTANTTAEPTELQFAHADFEGSIIEYKINQASSPNKIRVGTLLVATDGVNSSITDTYVETTPLDIEWNVGISGSNVEVAYNNTNATETATMRAVIKRIKA